MSIEMKFSQYWTSVSLFEAVILSGLKESASCLLDLASQSQSLSLDIFKIAVGIHWDSSTANATCPSLFEHRQNTLD